MPDFKIIMILKIELLGLVMMTYIFCFEHFQSKDCISQKTISVKFKGFLGYLEAFSRGILYKHLFRITYRRNVSLMVVKSGLTAEGIELRFLRLLLLNHWYLEVQLLSSFPGWCEFLGPFHPFFCCMIYAQLLYSMHLNPPLQTRLYTLHIII